MSIIALHFVAGTVAGSVFAVRALLILIAIVLVECLAVAAIVGLDAALCCAGSLAAIQVGYLAGVYLRAMLERKIAPPST
jgi:hypothetical protein